MRAWEEAGMAKRARKINGTTPYGDAEGATEPVVRSAISGRFVLSEDQAKKLAALKAAARQPTTLPHGF